MEEVLLSGRLSTSVKQESGVNFKVDEAARREGDPDALIASNDKIKSVLGWEPDYDDLEQIVKHALNWEKAWQERKEA